MRHSCREHPFMSLVSQPLSLFLPMKTAAALIEPPAGH
jgi:hypothetical protein